MTKLISRLQQCQYPTFNSLIGFRVNSLNIWSTTRRSLDSSKSITGKLILGGSSNKGVLVNQVKLFTSQPNGLIKGSNLKLNTKLGKFNGDIKGLNGWRFTSYRGYRPNWYQESSNSSFNKKLEEVDPNKLVKGIIGLNIAIFLLIRLAYLEKDPVKLNSIRRWVKLNLAASGLNLKEGRVWTLFTHCFTHEDPWHLISNLVTLFFFAPSVAASLGNRRFLQLYLASCLSSTFLFLAYNRVSKNRPIGQTGLTEGDLSFSVGASGNTMAFLAYYGLKFPFETIYLYFIPIPAIVAVGGLFVYDYIRCRNPATHGGANVNHIAHLGGALSGIVFYILSRRPPPASFRPTNPFGRNRPY